jgi:hypothetical protein
MFSKTRLVAGFLVAPLLLLAETFPTQALPWIDGALPIARAAQPLVYVSVQPRDGSNPTINVYEAGVPNPKRIGTVGQWDATTQPAALVVDQAGALYVSVVYGAKLNRGAIYVFPRGATSPAIKYTYDNPTRGEQEELGYRTGGSNVAVDTDGTIHTSGVNAADNTSEVLTFKPGQPKPVRILPRTAFGGVTPAFFALNRFHTLFMSYTDPLTQRNGIIAFRQGQNFGIDQGVDVPAVNFLELDRRGNYALSTFGCCVSGLPFYAIDVIAPGTVQPQRVLQFGGQFALDAANSLVYSVNNSAPNNVGVFRYADGKALWNISDGLNVNHQAVGIAIDPPPAPAP